MAISRAEETEFSSSQVRRVMWGKYEGRWRVFVLMRDDEKKLEALMLLTSTQARELAEATDVAPKAARDLRRAICQTERRNRASGAQA